MKQLSVRLLLASAGTSSLLLFAACGGGTGAGGNGGDSGGPSSQPPEETPPASEFVVRGEVLSFDTGMIADAAINVWVQTPGFGYSYWWANGPLWSDGLGLFEAEVPESNIFLLADSEEFVQPCAVRSGVTQDLEVRIEMLPKSALNVFNAPRPQLSVEPSITGRIFETKPYGRLDVTGADLRAQDVLETGLATTRSDLGGAFYLCNLPEDTYIDIRKVGFKPVLVGPIGGSESAVLEIELVRESEPCRYC